MTGREWGLRAGAIALALFAASCAQEPSAVGVEAVEVRASDGAVMGSVAFPVSCSDTEAEYVRRGLALLHNMTYAEAAGVFRGVVEREPSCGIGYWGIAMSYLHPLWPDVPNDEQLADGWALLEKARDVGLGTERERGFVTALEGYYRDAIGRDEPARLTTYAQVWQDVLAEFPGDSEMRLFAALALIATAPGSDLGFAQRIEAGEMAMTVLSEIPDHPGAHHYVIHAYDVPQLAERALDAARSYGSVAPENSHALHMTSHIFTRRGLWDESIEFNRRAADAALQEPVGGALSHHYLHAMDYLAYAHLQLGEDAEAAGILREMRSMGGPVVDNAVSAYALTAIPARLLLERGHWVDAARLQTRQPEQISWDAFPHLEAIGVFARAIGAARSGNPSQARQDAERLGELVAAAEQVPGAYEWATQVRIQELGANAWILKAEGMPEQALDAMRDAAELEATTQKNPVTPSEVLPAGELLGDMLLEMGRPADALTAYELALERSRNRFKSVLGAARAAAEAGRDAEADRYYTALIELAGTSQSRRAMIREAQSHLTQ